MGNAFCSRGSTENSFMMNGTALLGSELPMQLLRIANMSVAAIRVFLIWGGINTFINFLESGNKSYR
jgi:hypothetical protein